MNFKRKPNHLNENVSSELSIDTAIDIAVPISNQIMLLPSLISYLRKDHGKKRFVILTKSFVEIGITRTFCYNNKMFRSVNKTLGCCSKFFGCSNKKQSVVPNFVAGKKNIFSVTWDCLKQ